MAGFQVDQFRNVEERVMHKAPEYEPTDVRSNRDNTPFRTDESTLNLMARERDRRPGQARPAQADPTSVTMWSTGAIVSHGAGHGPGCRRRPIDLFRSQTAAGSSVSQARWLAGS